VVVSFSCNFATMVDVPAPLSANEFFTPEFLRDPYPTYRQHLDGRGLQYLSIHGGVWAVFKHADCSSFLRDPRLSAKRTGTLIDEFPPEKQKEFAELARTLSLWMLFFDAPEHARLRKLMNKGFSPAAIESLRPQVENLVERLLVPLRHETTRNLIGNGLNTLIRHPEQAAALRDHPEFIRSAVEELLRYESPVQYTGRMALEDFELCGVQARRGQEIIFMLGAANRDARQFKDPDRLDLKRVNNPHLAFGVGAHFCIGNQLARLEGQVAILKTLQEFPQMRRVSAEPDWLPNFTLRGLKTLLVEV
jgi:cytochrome P450